MKPLDGIRVLELGQLIAGPFCGQVLADFGAEVVKVELPGTGDAMRQWGREDREGRPVWWAVIARGKKSLTLDLREAAGQAVLRDLAREADVVIENFRPGTMERWGLGYEALQARNPRLVMVRVSGYGQDGPYASRAGFASVCEAMGGLRHISGHPDRPPVRMGVSLGDTLAGIHGAMGALLALEARHRTGRGQVVDSAIYEAVLAVTESLVAEYDQSGHVRERSGGSLPGIAPSNAYPTADGREVVIGANQDTVFGRLCEGMGRPELARDERFATHRARGPPRRGARRAHRRVDARASGRGHGGDAGGGGRAGGPGLHGARHAGRPPLRGARGDRAGRGPGARAGGDAERLSAPVGHAGRRALHGAGPGGRHRRGAERVARPFPRAHRGATLGRRDLGAGARMTGDGGMRGGR